MTNYNKRVFEMLVRVLGIDHDSMVPDKTNRPYGISHGGKPIREIMA